MSRTYDHGGNIFTTARKLGLTPDQLTDFSASINPLGISPMVRKALLCSLDILIHYPDSSQAELKQALACFHNLLPENFAIANGSTEIIYNLPGMLPGKKALIIAPAFSEYVHSLDQHGWETEHFVLSPDNNFSIDLGKLEKALTKDIDALYVCNPGNPNGALHNQSVVEQVRSLCLAAGTFLVLDEAFMDFCEEASAKKLIVQCEKSIVLRSMTKFFGIPGLRLGYAIGNRNLTSRLETMGGPWSVNTLAMAAGVAALQDSAHNRRTLDFIRLERQTLTQELKQFAQFRVFPSDVNYLLVEIKNDLNAGELADRLLSHRILIRDCSSFMGLSDRFFRIAVRSSEENQRLLECLREIFR